MKRKCIPFLVLACTLAGLGGARVDGSAPAAPQDLADVTVGQGTALVTWSPGAGGEAVAHYDVLVDGVIKQRVDGGEVLAEVTGLSPGSTHEITVMAVSEAGVTSGPSEPIRITTKLRNLDANGWTIIKRSPDTRVVYVSSSGGDDANDGLSPEKPKKTLAEAAKLIREPSADHLLLKRGDVWRQEHLDRFKTGRSDLEPIVVSYYGDSGPRPVLEISRSFYNPDGQSRRNVAFIGLDIYAYFSDPNHPEYTGGYELSGIRMAGIVSNILIEDCVVRYCTIASMGCCNGDVTRNSNIAIRRSIIVDNWALNTCSNNSQRPEGIYVSRTDNLLIEECLFDHNGWSEAEPGRSMYNHNIYLQGDNKGDIILRGNIIARGSSHGVQMRAGGIAEDNLFIRNPCQIFLNGNAGSAYTATARIARRNVVLEGESMGTCQNASTAVWAIEAASDSATLPIYIVDNIVAHLVPGTTGYIRALKYTVGPSLISTGNIVHKLVASENTADPGWVDPERSVGAYNATIGGAPTLEAFLAAVRARGPGEWPQQLTAYAVNNYIRDGFRLKGSVAATGIQLQEQRVSVRAGETVPLNVQVLPANAANPAIRWDSSAHFIAAPAEGGMITGNLPGEARITATSVDNLYSASCIVRVYPAAASFPAAGDPDDDGLPNLVEYAIGADHAAPDALADVLLGDPAAPALSLRFQRAAADLDYTVEASADLATWSTLSLNPGLVGQQVSVTDSAGGQARFVRLKVSPR